MFCLAGTVLSNTRLEQVIIFIKHYTLLAKKTVVVLTNKV